MDLSTPLDLICRIIVRARENEAQVPGVAADDAEDPNDADDDLDALEDETNTSVEEEMQAALEDLADDQLAELVALAWVGHGTYDVGEWDEALEEATELGPEAAVDELFDMPTLSADLEAGLAAFDLSCDGVGQVD